MHYNSAEPAQLNALAYAQGTDIHIAPGQEKHLPHEAWHVVQQKQGRVQPTMQMKGGVAVNDDRGLEKEADVMGGRAWLNNKNNIVQKREIVDSKFDADFKGVAQFFALNKPVIQLQTVPVGFDRVAAAKPGDKLVTSGLANCIAVAVIDTNKGYAVMGHFHTGLIDFRDIAHYNAFKELLLDELRRVSPAKEVNPVFFVSLGTVWLDVPDDRAKMRHVVINNCLSAFKTEPIDGGETAVFEAGIMKGSSTTSEDTEPPPDNWNDKGEEIPYRELRNSDPEKWKLKKNLSWHQKLF